MAAKAVLETGRSIDAVFDQRLTPVVPLMNERIAHGKSVALDGGAPVCAHADLWKACDFLCEFLCLCARGTFGRHVLT